MGYSRAKLYSVLHSRFILVSFIEHYTDFGYIRTCRDASHVEHHVIKLVANPFMVTRSRIHKIHDKPC